VINHATIDAHIYICQDLPSSAKAMQENGLSLLHKVATSGYVPSASPSQRVMNVLI